MEGADPQNHALPISLLVSRIKLMNCEDSCNVQCVSTYISKRGIVQSATLVYTLALASSETYQEY